MIDPGFKRTGLEKAVPRLSSSRSTRHRGPLLAQCPADFLFICELAGPIDSGLKIGDMMCGRSAWGDVRLATAQEYSFLGGATITGPQLLVFKLLLGEPSTSTRICPTQIQVRPAWPLHR